MPLEHYKMHSKGLTLEAGLQLAKGVHLGRFPQVMQISTTVPCHH